RVRRGTRSRRAGPLPRACREVQDTPRSRGGRVEAPKGRAVQALDNPLKLSIVALGAALVLIGGAGTSSGQRSVTVKLGSVVPENSIWDKNLKQMGAEWSEASGGPVAVALVSRGVQGGR